MFEVFHCVDVELEFFEEVVVGVRRVVVGGDPFGGMAQLDEERGVGDGGVSPSDLVLILLREVLGLVDDGIASFKERDQALVGVEHRVVSFYSFRISVIPHEELIVGDISEHVAVRGDFEAEGGAWMEGVVGFDVDAAKVQVVAVAQVVVDQFRFDVVEADGEVCIGEDFKEDFARSFAEADGNIDVDFGFGVVDRAEEGEADEVVPVGVA